MTPRVLINNPRFGMVSLDYHMMWVINDIYLSGCIQFRIIFQFLLSITSVKISQCRVSLLDKLILTRALIFLARYHRLS